MKEMYLKIISTDGSEAVFRVTKDLETIRSIMPEIDTLDVFKDDSHTELSDHIFFDINYNHVMSVEDSVWELHDEHPGFRRKLDEFASNFI